MRATKRFPPVLYVAGVGAAASLYLTGPLNAGPVFNLIGASAIVAILVGAWLNRPAPRLPWYLFAFGQALFVTGDIIAYNYQRFFGRELPFPSIADLFYLGFYPALGAGLLVLLRRRSPGHDRASMIDSSIVFVGATAVSWAYLMAPYAHDASLTLHTKLISMAYPLMDVLLLGVTVRLAVGSGRRGAAFRLLTLGIVALLITDAIYGWKQLHGGYETGGLLDGGWILFYASFAAAALHPSMRDLSEPGSPPSARLSRHRLALLAGATLVAPTILVVRIVLDQPVDVAVLAAASAALSLLVVARIGGLMRDQEETVRRETILREVGEGLVSASTREDICSAAVAAARSLCSMRCLARLYLMDDAHERLAAVAATDADIRELPPLPVGELHPPVAGRANGGARPASCLIAREAESSRGPEAAEAWFSPLLVRGGELQGVLAVCADEELPKATGEALDALASQLALALERASLAEDFMRTRAEARLSSLVKNASDVVSIVASDATITYVSPSAERVLGHRAETLTGTRFVELVHPDDAPALTTLLAKGLRQPQSGPVSVELRISHSDGRWLNVETLATNLLEDPSVGGFVLNTRDISDRKAFEAELSHRAFHDTLTGLPNRALFSNRAEHALERQGRSDRVVAVLFLDLDDFKAVNDSLGHAAGDKLLCELAGRLTACIRKDDTAARLGGDEFALLLDGLGSEVEAAGAADRVMAALSDGFSIDGREVFTSASLGIAFGGPVMSGARGADELLRNADVAMYTAKERGKSRYHVFEPRMHAAVFERLELKADLQRAVQRREFTVEYQPVIELANERIVGFEALVRWDHPLRGRIPPVDFIGLAEETGLIVPLGRLVLDEACDQIARFQRECPQAPPLAMSVNLSARQLQDPELATHVREGIARTGIPPGSLVLELTESVMMQETDLAILRMHELRAFGVRLAIDDFGTGYSSLNYIRQFPIDILKIDRSFIKDITEEGQVLALTASILDLARVLGLDPVAEGIERPEQLQRLRELGCRFGQGFYFHKPVPAGTAAELAAKQAGAVDSPAESSLRAS